MKVVVIGTRGIPGIQGGVETHCENLYPELVKLGCDVTVIRRRCYVNPDYDVDTYKGVKIIDTWAWRNKNLEAALHTMMAVFKARTMHPDIVHIHAIGPSLFAPLARLLGMKVVSTHHGADYKRAKWGWMARMMLRLGQWCQVKTANRIIAISDSIADDLAYHHGRSKGVDVICNGVGAPTNPTGHQYLDSLGLERGNYILTLARFVPEKRLDLLIDAYSRCDTHGMKLVIAGDSDHDNPYSRALKERATAAGATMTGFIKGEQLAEIMDGAALFVLPSAHEGLPISLLEAMTWGIDVLASDIDANRLPELNDSDFFACGDIDSLCAALERKTGAPAARRTYDMNRYMWPTIARATLDTYNATI